MNVIAKISVASLLLFSFFVCNAQTKKMKTEIVKIYGNCEMCEKTIETAGNLKKVAMVDWNKDSKMASIRYNSAKTNMDEILKRIALAGYDSDKFLAPDDVYSKLPGCCQYERVNKTAIVQVAAKEDHTMHMQEKVADTKQEENQLKALFEHYFTLKDALVNSDGKSASASAQSLLGKINAVQMEKLSMDEHVVWMKVLNKLKAGAEKIAATSNIENQRSAFMDLSALVYDLIKVSKPQDTIYYQNCPMYNDGKGANWLSKESSVKNPYFGSQMMSCGKTIETIK